MKSFLLIIPFFIFSCAQTSKKLINDSDGTLRDDVRRTMRSKLAVIKDCYMAEFKSNPKIEGKMVFAFDVLEGGIVKNIVALPDSSTLKNENMEKCIANILSEAKFPDPGNGIQYFIKYPFVFDSKGSNSSVTVHQ